MKMASMRHSGHLFDATVQCFLLRLQIAYFKGCKENRLKKISLLSRCS